MLFLLLLFCNATSLCFLLISSTQSTDVILSPEGRNDLCKWKNSSICMIPVRTMWSQHFFKVNYAHYLNCTYCVPDNVLFEENRGSNGTGWNFSSSHCTSTLVHGSVRVCVWLVIALVFDCKRASPVVWPLLQQVSIFLHDCTSQWPGL